MNYGGEKNSNYRHGLRNNGERHPLYTAWQNMKQRCLNPNQHKFHRYGGRGISICDDWMVCENFTKWAFANGWRKGLTLDRINNDGNYEPENCQWIICGLNSRKKSTTKLTIHDAEKIRKAVLNGEDEHDLANQYGVSHGTVWFIINKMTWDEAL